MSEVMASDIVLVKTCDMCPEQYDAMCNGELVGYLRLRHSGFSVECPYCGGEEVYYADVDDSGWTGSFADIERDSYLNIAKNKIAEWINRRNAECPK